MKKRLLVSIALLLLLSTYISEKNLKFKSIFNIKEITVKNNKLLSKKDVMNDLSFLYGHNLLFINSKKIENKLRKNSLIEKFEIKKIYPNKIIVKIFEKNPIFILQNKKKKYYYTDKNNLINFSKIKKFEDLPIVFGDKISFQIFYNNLKKIKFPINTIKTFYLFESNRWDLLTQNNTTIKLPIKNYEQSLKNFLDIKEKKNFNKYKIFDYRINDQLILK